MPWSNVPKHLEGKMESCVQSVQRGGKTKKQAIAICYSRIVGSSVSNEARKRAGRRK